MRGSHDKRKNTRFLNALSSWLCTRHLGSCLTLSVLYVRGPDVRSWGKMISKTTANTNGVPRDIRYCPRLPPRASSALSTNISPTDQKEILRPWKSTPYTLYAASVCLCQCWPDSFRHYPLFIALLSLFLLFGHLWMVQGTRGKRSLSRS